MTNMGYVQGVTTFRAYTDLEPYRLVRMHAGSTTEPPEVEYTDNGYIVGVTDSAALAGQEVSVKPLNVDGNFSMACHVDTEITYATDLYMDDDGTGRVTDRDTGLYIGQSVSHAGTVNQIIQVTGVTGAVAISDASDVSIIDAGGYYTSDNVEGALQEVGAVLAHRDVYQFIAPFDFCRVQPASPYNSYSAAELGGRLASDSDRIVSNGSYFTSGFITAQTALAQYQVGRFIFGWSNYYPYDTVNYPLTVAIQIGPNGTTAGDYTFDVALTTMLDDGTHDTFSASSVAIHAAGAPYFLNLVTRPAATPGNPVWFNCSISVTKQTATAEVLDFLSARIYYKTPAI